VGSIGLIALWHVVIFILLIMSMSAEYLDYARKLNSIEYTHGFNSYPNPEKYKAFKKSSDKKIMWWVEGYEKHKEEAELNERMGEQDSIKRCFDKTVYLEDKK
jgi:hypothetical protein